MKAHKLLKAILVASLTMTGVCTTATLGYVTNHGAAPIAIYDFSTEAAAVLDGGGLLADKTDGTWTIDNYGDSPEWHCRGFFGFFGVVGVNTPRTQDGIVENLCPALEYLSIAPARAGCDNVFGLPWPMFIVPSLAWLP